MKHLLKAGLLAVSLLTSGWVGAHGDHGHAHEIISEQQVLELAVKAAHFFSAKDTGISFGKLDESWQALQLKDAKIIEKGVGYFIAQVENAQVKKSLYLLVDDAGNLHDANLTGTFAALEAAKKAQAEKQADSAAADTLQEEKSKSAKP
tara:strand:+ start:1461 stop:1907 length:447 start_codon:yes stop_codon:yes gene_type:complete